MTCSYHIFYQFHFISYLISFRLSLFHYTSYSKTKAVVIPTSKLNENILEDADLAGPLFYCLALGMCLLMSGKVHFGYIYGFSVFGCFSMYAVINLLHSQGLDFWRTCSVLGYSLIPVIGLAALSILIDLRGTLGFILSFIVIFWSTLSSTRIFHAKLHLTEQYWLVAYPNMLLYSCFVLITIFQFSPLYRRVMRKWRLEILF